MTLNPPDIIRVGRNRVRIKEGSPNSPALARVVSWLRTRPEVALLEPKLGALEVTLKEPSGASGSLAFMRALEDFVYTLTQAPIVVFGVQIVHAVPGSHGLPGRIRLRFVGASDDDLLRLVGFIGQMPGVARVTPSLASDSILVLFDHAATSPAEIVSAIRQSDAKMWPAVPPAPQPKTQSRLMAFNSVVLAATASAIVPEPALAAAVALTALPTLRRTFKALKNKKLTVDALDVAAIATSVATGQYATGAFITWLLGIGDLLLEHTADRAHAAVSKLMHLDASEAWRLKNGQVEKIPPKALKIGDHIVVAAGQSVAADGIVRSGAATVDEKALTGESVPRVRKEGDRILAATVVVEGQVVVEVERMGGDTTAAKIVKILEGYGVKPMTLQRDAERVADQLVLPTFALAGGVTAATGEIARMTSVLITDFGTGIRIAVPMNALASMTVAARQGVLVKGAQHLERLSKADLIVFDKTGTLTRGRPDIVDAVAVSGFTLAEVMALACGLEVRQSHPIAGAFHRYAAEHQIVPREPQLGSEEHVIGLGLRARTDGQDLLLGSPRWLEQNAVDCSVARETLAGYATANTSALLLAIDGLVAGVFAHADRPRPESAAVVQALRAGGRRRVALISGDAQGPVQAVARMLGVDEAFGEMLPHDKAAFVQARQKQGHIVAMVGDGINDAPALALADVGVSLHEGTDVALETADVILLEGGLEKLVLAFETGDLTMQRVRASLGLVIAPNVVAMALGALGVISPAMASVLNNGSTVLAALSAVAPMMRSRGRERSGQK